MIKFSKYECFKFALILIIILSVFVMKIYPEYGGKGVYNLSEHGTESNNYENKISEKTKINGNDCDKECRNNEKLDKISAIIRCLDSCSKNNHNYIIIGSSIKPLYFWIIFVMIITTFMLFYYYQEELEGIVNYTYDKLKRKLLNISGNKSDKENINDEECESINEYTKLTDI